MYRTIGPTNPGFGSPASSTPNPPITAIGNGPFSMNRAVIKPHAMNAAIFGMIIPDRNVPNFWTATRVLDVLLAGAASVLTTGPLPRAGADRQRWSANELVLPIRVVPEGLSMVRTARPNPFGDGPRR